MKITNVAGPLPQSSGPEAPSQAQQAAKERAIQALMGTKPSSAQVDAAPAEVVIAQGKANISTQTTETKGQIDTGGEPAESPEVPKANQPEKVEEPISSQYAVLARREKAFRAKVEAEQAKLKAERDAFEREKAEITAKQQTYEKDYIPKQKLAEETIETLLEAGLSYDQITERFLAQQNSAPVDPALKAEIKAMRAEIANLKGENEKFKKGVEQQSQDSYNQALKQIEFDVTDLVKSDSTRYEAIAKTGSQRDVVKLIDRMFKEEGRILSNEEAADMIESELVESISQYASISKIQKQRQLAADKPVTPKTTVNVQAHEQQAPMPVKTLTNQLSGSPKLTARQRALLAFEGKLGK